MRGKGEEGSKKPEAKGERGYKRRVVADPTPPGFFKTIVVGGLSGSCPKQFGVTEVKKLV